MHLRTRRRITLPKAIRQEARLAPGDELDVAYENGQIIFRPIVHIPRVGPHDILRHP
ncbi:MAG: AbrB/MazE/SpoVT family DNA-binding domain-containing protein [Candidatus Omnitrophica bacterium]|nr:AbrB/MazE/SpoVT family DNA-binding domain-containing protein [Candidatus Omnitrophota bacterium]